MRGALSSSATGFTVADALREEALAEARLAAGAAGTGAPVRAVGVLDVADLAGVSPGQFVLATAYALLEEDLGRLVQQLSRRGASALGIKLEPYWPAMPEPLLAAAEEAALPLLELPPGRFEDLMAPLLATMLDRQARELRAIAGLHHDLAQAALRDEDPGSAARILARALEREVAIFDEDGELLLAGGGDPEQWEGLGRDASHEKAMAWLERDGVRHLVVPISARGQRYGTICVQGADPADATVRAAAAEAAVVTGLQLLGRRQMESVHRRFETEVLDDLIAGRLTDQEARTQAERMGWPVRRPYLVLLLARRAQTGRAGRAGRELAEIAIAPEDVEALQRSLRVDVRGARPFRYLGGLGLLVPLRREEDPEVLAGTIASRLGRAHRVPWAGDRLLVAAARPRQDIAELPAAVREARISLQMAASDGRVRHFDELGVAALLAQAGDRDRLLRMAREELAALGDLQTRAGQDLLETLEVLLARNLRLADSAQELFFHYNTVRHRVGRLRELLGPRLDCPDGWQTLWIAVLAVRLAELEPGP